MLTLTNTAHVAVLSCCVVVVETGDVGLVREGRCAVDSQSNMTMHLNIRSFFFVCIALAPGVAGFYQNYQNHGRSTCFALNMVGFGNQSNRRHQESETKSPPKPVAEKQPTPKPPLNAGELPEDAFSQFPPLSAHQQSTLESAKDALASGDGRTGLPAEVSAAVSGRYTYIHRQQSEGFTVYVEFTTPLVHIIRTSSHSRTCRPVALFH